MKKDEKLKILITLRTNILLGAGTEKVAAYYAMYLPKDIWEVHIMMTDIMDHQRLDPSELEESGVNNFYQIHSVENKFNFVKRMPKIGFAVFEALQYFITFLNKFINKETLNQMKQYDLAYHIYFLTPIITFGKGDINIVSEHTLSARTKDSLTSTFAYCLHYLFMHNNDFLHALSHRTLGERYAGLPVVTIGNGYDSRLFYPRPIKVPELITFAFLARLEPGKGLRTVLEAWKIARERGLRSSKLRIIGSGSLSSLLENFNDDSVIYHGNVPTPDLAEILGSCDFFIYPSVADMFPQVVLEALGSGCHVLTTSYFKGIYDRENTKGFLEYLERDPEMFADRIVGLKDEVNIYRKARFSQADTIKDSYEWKKVVSRLSEFLLSAVRAKK